MGLSFKNLNFITEIPVSATPYFVVSSTMPNESQSIKGFYGH